MGFWDNWDWPTRVEFIKAEERDLIEEWRRKGEENNLLSLHGLKDGENMYVRDGFGHQKTFVRRGNVVDIHYNYPFQPTRTVFVSSSEKDKNMTVYDGPSITPYSPIPFQTSVVKSGGTGENPLLSTFKAIDGFGMSIVNALNALVASPDRDEPILPPIKGMYVPIQS